MVNDEMLRLSLIEIMNMDLLNNFVNRIFGYRIGDNEFVYIQYKIVKDNMVLNVFDNTRENRFRAFIFTLNNIDSDEDTMYINIKESYDKWKDKKTKKKLCLLGALLYSNNNQEKKRLLNLYLMMLELNMYYISILFYNWFISIFFFY